MNRDERKKAIADAVAVASGNVLMPAALRVGLVAIAEELGDLRARADIAENRFFILEGEIYSLKRKNDG